MIDLKEFLKKGFIEAVGKMEDYKIRIDAMGWLDKGYLTESDITEINDAIENQYKVEEPTEEIIEEPIEETTLEEGIEENTEESEV